MALFTVSRYLGEEENEIQETKLDASEILKQIQIQAKARKKSLIKGFASIDIDKKPVKNKNEFSQEGKHVVASDDTGVYDNQDDIPTPKKKKKRSLKSSDTDVNESLDSTPESKKLKQSLEKNETKGSKNQMVSASKLRDSVSKKMSVSFKASEECMDVDVDENNSDVESDKSENSNEDAKAMETEDDHEKNNEIGGFTVIGDVKAVKVEKVKRVLPEWLSKPNVVSGNLSSSLLPVTEMPLLEEDLKNKLLENKITHFFPVQMQVIPALLESSMTGFQTGRAGYRPSDICVSAPTGSGKTLAFVLPIVEALRSRVRCEVRALAVLPVRDLATQVYKVFQTYCAGTQLKVGLLVGQKTLATEQQSLVTKRLRGYQSMYDIIVATPGRLVDHINKTDGFNLGHLRYLVIDEADRMMDEIKQDWLVQVESAVFKSRPLPSLLTAASSAHMQIPLQKLLYSATLSQNPEKLQQLNLFQPRLFTSVMRAAPPALSKSVGGGATLDTRLQEGGNTGKEKMEESHDNDRETKEADKTSESSEFVGKYSTPAGLKEYCIESSPGDKPLIVLHLLHTLKFRQILCFTNSLEATHRLYLLVKLFGDVEVREFSSGLHAAHRDRIIQKFAEGKIDIIICSDAMARGMDIANVKYVVSYDSPAYIQTYIHRIGRTARAGKEGTALTLMQGKEFFHFKKMVRDAGKQKVPSMKVYKNDLRPLTEKYKEALKQLPEILKNEKKKHGHKRPKKKEGEKG